MFGLLAVQSVYKRGYVLSPKYGAEVEIRSDPGQRKTHNLLSLPDMDVERERERLKVISNCPPTWSDLWLAVLKIN